MNNQPAATRRSEKSGLVHFIREMAWALVMAFIAIVYVIQAFKIPTGSMEDSLLVGDFLLGLKFIYGAPVLPFMYRKLPAVTDPKQGDVIIFKFPGTDKKDYIKRCVAGPGQIVSCMGTTLQVDGKELVLPPKGKFIRGGNLDPRITVFAPLRIPKKGDVLDLDTLSTREFLFAKHLIHQESPRRAVTIKVQLYINGVFANNQKIISGGYQEFSFEEIQNYFNLIDNWTDLDHIFSDVKERLAGQQVDIRKLLFLDGQLQHSYTVRNDNYFMMGDNRDNSTDSRYWGYLNRNFIKAKAFILYFSWDKDAPPLDLIQKIRWNRIGKLIRSWDGQGKSVSASKDTPVAPVKPMPEPRGK
ncbi:MAG: signal peptidase I [Chitinivibrionales bacterium]|nr:signal peptidase I [Chitinivibrionales bacterium]